LGSCVVVGEGDLEVDLDAPAGDADCLDDQAQEPLAAVEVELVEGGEHALGEAGESAPQPVLGRELGAAIGEFGVLGCELVAAGGEGGGAARELVEIEQRGMVGVEQPAASSCSTRRATGGASRIWSRAIPSYPSSSAAGGARRSRRSSGGCSSCRTTWRSRTRE
jgi:hypothetical protein